MRVCLTDRLIAGPSELQIIPGHLLFNGPSILGSIRGCACVLDGGGSAVVLRQVESKHMNVNLLYEQPWVMHQQLNPRIRAASSHASKSGKR